MDNMATNDFSWGSNILQAWVYFRESINSPYGMESWQVLYDFYGSLDILGRKYVDTIFLGETFNMDPFEVLNYLDYLVETTPCLTQNNDYDFQNSPMEQSNLDVAQEKTFSETMLEFGETMLEHGRIMQASIDKMFIDLNLINETFINENDTLQIHDSMPLVEMDSTCNQISNHNVNGELEYIDDAFDESLSLEGGLKLDQNIINLVDSDFKIDTTHSNPTMHPIVDTELSREHIYLKQAELDRLWLENENLELDELERLIFNPKTLDSENEVIIELDHCINNELFLSSDLLIPSHINEECEIESKTSIDEFDHKLEFITTTCDEDTEKIVTTPPKKFFIDFIIPDFNTKTDRTILLIYFLQFSFYSNKFLWRHCGQRKSKYWLGNFPYWVEFGSVEFMPFMTMMHACNNLNHMDGSSLLVLLTLFSLLLFLFSHYSL